MASPDARRLTETHRLAQARIGAVTVQQVRTVFPLLDPEDLDGSFQNWLRAVFPLIQAQRTISARLAGNYLSMFKSLELGLSAPRAAVVLAESASPEAVSTSMLVTGPAAIKAAMRRGVPLARAMSTAEVSSARAALRHALNGGRDTISASVRADRHAVGYARAASGNACAYCARLAGIEFADDHVFEAHDGCSCTSEPVYR